MLLALAQFLKKEIFQKFIAPAFWFISKLNFVGDEIMADYVRTFFILLWHLIVLELQVLYKFTRKARVKITSNKESGVKT